MSGGLYYDKKRTRAHNRNRRAKEQYAHTETKISARKAQKSAVFGRLPESFLRKAYTNEKKSVREIAAISSCSAHKVSYWLVAYSIPIRSKSEAGYYAKHKESNQPSFIDGSIPFEGDPFLVGLGFGIYQAIGDKSGNHIQIGSSNPRILRAFIRFLCSICGVHKDSLRFGLRIGRRADEASARAFWTKELSIVPAQFRNAIIVTVKREKNKQKRIRGFLTLHYYNSKLKRALMENVNRRTA